VKVLQSAEVLTGRLRAVAATIKAAGVTSEITKHNT